MPATRVPTASGGATVAGWDSLSHGSPALCSRRTETLGYCRMSLRDKARSNFRKALHLARIFQCAVKTEQDSRGGENPTRQLSLRRKQSGRAPLATAAGEAPDVKGSCKRVSERAGPNMSEHRESLEKGNANADPLETWGRLAGRGKRAKRAPRPSRRGSGEDMRAMEICGNTGNPTRREVKAPGQQPARARLGRAGWRRGSYERRSRVMPVEQRGLSSRTMTKEGKARRLA